MASAERIGGGITSFGYDHADQRAFKATGTATTSYPSRYYHVASTSQNATATKHILSPDGTLLATVEGSGTGSATTTFVHADHLGGTNIVTDEDGEVAQTLDYYPYGAERISSGTNSTDRHFIGERYDSSEDLNYLNARYYRNAQGQFMSQDPASRDNPGQFLGDPQQMNSYAYSRNNPIKFLPECKTTIEFTKYVFPFGSHNAIAGYNVPGFAKGTITIGGYPSSHNPFTNKLIAVFADTPGRKYSRYDYEIARQIFESNYADSGAIDFTIVKDFGGLTEEQYWGKLMEERFSRGTVECNFRNSNSVN